MHQLKWLLVTISIFVFGCGSSDNTKKDTSSVDRATIPFHVACVGDSITEGFKLKNPSVESYPAQLSKLVANNIRVENFGIRGRSIIKAGEQSYWDSEMYQKSLHFNPDIVIIMLGSNDMKDANFGKREEIVKDYNALIQSYKNMHSKPTIYICFPPPSYGSIRGITDKRLTEVLIPKIKEVAQQNGISIIDMHTLLSNKKELFPDTLHPNVEGTTLMAEKVYATIY